ncbi:SDR family NAD(P)-dependent oxidoreductase [Bdellovibrio bacteriovorus]|uniref:SDR family NAD(P)-dependent oxidoreductase n=1 Tax=Bdellovibrio bacteriovorus TaxID=959 RepID=UPI0035A63ADB
MSKTAIITGAGGFLGSHISETLLKKGYNIVAVDNFCTGHRQNKEILESYDKHILFIEADVTAPWTWMSDVPEEWKTKLSHIFHFASPASPPLYQRLSIETIWVNTLGLERAILEADKYNARVIFASTSEVYGDPDCTTQNEKYWGNVNSYGERSCYDEAKRLGESLIFSYNKRNRTKHGLVRIFNTYGPRMNPQDGRVIINFIVQALQGQPLTVYGNGKQTRSFCYVSDLVDGILKYADSDITQPMNLGNDREFTILQVATIVQSAFPNKKIDIIFKDLPSDDPKKRRPDLSFAKNELPSWSPKVPLESGVEIMIDWIKQIEHTL